MRELSLFTGAGGGIYGTKLLGWKTVGYVEIEDYCQKVITQRIKDGIFDEAPIFGDIRSFISEGYAESYSHMVDVITAGFPCQPFSVAGKRKGRNDERNMWPETIRCIRAVQPQWCLLENVPGLLANHGYFGTILRDLAESGYDARWDLFSAAAVGAPHIRKRIFLLAHSIGNSIRPNAYWNRGQDESAKLQSKDGKALSDDIEPVRAVLADPDGNGRDTWRAESEGFFRQAGVIRGGEEQEPERSDWWTTEPSVGRVVNGLAHRCDRIRTLGNGQVPGVVREAWRRLNEQP